MQSRTLLAFLAVLLLGSAWFSAYQLLDATQPANSFSKATKKQQQAEAAVGGETLKDRGANRIYVRCQDDRITADYEIAFESSRPSEDSGEAVRVLIVSIEREVIAQPSEEFEGYIYPSQSIAMGAKLSENSGSTRSTGEHAFSDWLKPSSTELKRYFHADELEQVRKQGYVVVAANFSLTTSSERMLETFVASSESSWDKAESALSKIEDT